MTMTTERCLLDGCDRLVYARGACSPHYQKYRAQGRLDELAAQPMMKTCATCGATFQPKARRQDVTYCSRKCIDAARMTREKATKPAAALECEHCGRPLIGKRSDARFCDAQCSHAWNHRRRLDGGYQRPSQAGRPNTGFCGTCGASLVGKRPQAKYCSVACGMRSNNQRYIAERRTERAAAPRPKCQTCGGDVPLGGQRSFCSAECRQAGIRPRKYGLTKLELDAMMVSQGHLCAMCRTDEWGGKGPHIDHSHNTGKVRGILCNDCNVALSRLHDDPARAQAAIDYLERTAAP